MLKIATKLIESGMDFNYENYNSEGEKIICFPLCIVIVEKNGTVYLSHLDTNEQFKSIEAVLPILDRLIIEETTGN
ncbi:hypothetical protein [Lacihabitans soyangensis]|uniref:Uncharacterized protein n=1 Tax=Lacihabitans soyangensis TaxID=869394 RepID=A0AAE3H648_9BACT|nr:hypothetical protein [Lacihabitans soyangensis]MCP9765162.1 hypothetical protein [Lacihabitans soyangensis]